MVEESQSSPDKKSNLAKEFVFTEEESSEDEIERPKLSIRSKRNNLN